MVIKRLCLTIISIMLIGLIPSNVFAESHKSISPLGEHNKTDIHYAVGGGNIYFRSNTGAIVDSDDSVEVATIPSSINGYTVKRIGENAFESRYALYKVIIPNSVTTIEGGSFWF